MRNAWCVTGVPAVVAVAGIGLLVLWFCAPSGYDLQARVPQEDREVLKRVKPEVGDPQPGSGQPSDISATWPRFRGSDLDAISKENVALADKWPEGGPKQLWSLDLGEGYAGAAVADGCVYVLDYDQDLQADTMRCLSLDDGAEIWRNSYPVVIKRFHGMSRTVPTIVAGRVVSFGPKNHVVCWDAKTGHAHWIVDLVLQYGATTPEWYAGQCPLVEDDRVILAPGGETLLVALDLATGEPVWKSPNPRRWLQTHVSIMPMELAGRWMYVYCGSGGVAGIAADDGSLLWETTDWRISIATCSSPLVLPKGKIFLSGGYAAGAVMLQIKEENGAFVAETLYRLDFEQFGSTQQTPIYYEGHIYGVRPDEQLVCLDPDGNEVWASGSRHKFGIGPYMIAGGMIYVMDNFGLLTLAEATPDGYQQLSQAQVLDGHDAWGPMALVAGRLMVRDLERMVCLDVAEQ